MTESKNIHPEELKIHLSTLQQLLLARTNVIITIAALIIGILVIASFNEKIITVSPVLIILIVFLLALLPIAIMDYLFKLGKAETNLFKRLGDKTGEEKLEQKRLFKQAIDGSMYIYAALISVIVLIVIDLILKNIIWTFGIFFLDFLIISILYKYSE